LAELENGGAVMVDRGLYRDTGNHRGDSLGRQAEVKQFTGKRRPLLDFECDWCGDPFQSRDPKAKYCCPAHGNAAWQKANRTGKKRKNTITRALVN